MRIREPKTTALIFASGKMVVTGAKSEDDSRYVVGVCWCEVFVRTIQWCDSSVSGLVRTIAHVTLVWVCYCLLLHM